MVVSVGLVLCMLAACGSVTSAGDLRAAEADEHALPKRIEFDGFELDLRPGRTTVVKALRGLPAPESSADLALPGRTGGEGTSEQPSWQRRDVCRG